MKHTIIKLSILFVTMSVLTSSREDLAIKKSNTSFLEQSCLQSKNDCAINVTCSKTSVVQGKKDLPVASAADLDVPLSPISRFILLQ